MPNRADDCILVIFGASGDLTRRKLLPAIYNLAEAGHLPERFAIVGVARPRITVDDYRRQMRERVTNAEGERSSRRNGRASKNACNVSGEFHDERLYEVWPRRCRSLDPATPSRRTTCSTSLSRRISSPRLPIVWRHRGWRRNTTAGGESSSKNRSGRPGIGPVPQRPTDHGFRESQIYRIDHYLGKETVQNILAFRFANGIFEPIWNRRYVDHVQMTVAEDEGIGSRGAYTTRRARFATSSRTTCSSC